MTNNDELEVQVAPLVRIALHGEDDYEVAFSVLNEDANTMHDPASVSDPDVLDLVATHLDIDLDELARRVYGGTEGKLVVGRPQTGNIIIRGETVLG